MTIVAPITNNRSVSANPWNSPSGTSYPSSDSPILHNGPLIGMHRSISTIPNFCLVCTGARQRPGR